MIAQSDSLVQLVQPYDGVVGKPRLASENCSTTRLLLASSPRSSLLRKSNK